MKMKILNTLVVLAMVLALPVLATGSVDTSGDVVMKPSIAVGAMPRTGTHLVMPRDETILLDLQDKGKISLNASEEVKAAALKEYKQEFLKKSDTWVNPQMEELALQREEQLASASPMAPEAIQPVDVTIFTLAVDFDNTSTETVYYDDVFSADGCDLGTILSDDFIGPEVGNVPYPAAGDNNSLWYDPAEYADDVSFYNQLIYGYDGVGRVRTGDLVDPRDGLPGINLSGFTVQDYYDHIVGEGYVNLSGNTFGWVSVDHPEAYYGADSCSGSHYGGAYESPVGPEVPVAKLVKDAVEVFNAENPGFYWPDYDQNGDGIVDTFWVIYAGVGQEAGGGALQEFALWSHSSDASYYYGGGRGILVYDGGNADPSDDIYVGPYTMQPEMADVGVMTEEFGHNVFGLPDLYVTDTQGSIAFWSTMEAGSWGGYLGGTQPVGMPLWFRIIAWCGTGPCNWQSPMLTREYDDLSEDVTIRQLEEQTFDPANVGWGPTTPHGSTYKGVRINLPPSEVYIPNNVGTGNAAWSGTGNMADLTLARSVDVPAYTDHDIFLDVPSYWDIEEDYDYGYFEVDSGSGWTILSDSTGYCVTGPLGCGLTGFDYDTLQYDLTDYAGTTISIRFHYATDPFVNGAGWWLDDIMLDGVLVDDFSAATLPDNFPSWTNDGWDVTPFSESHTQYYLVEWRNATKYDQSVQTAYVTTDYAEDLWTVERVPYNIPGALVYYRNTAYSGTYAQTPNYGNPPSYGPKYQLLLVDMNYMPVPVGEYGETGSFFYPTVGSYDASITLDATDPFTITHTRSFPGPFVYDSKPAVTGFNDALQYYSGYVVDEDTMDFYSGFDDSAVIPARDLYSVSGWDWDSGHVPYWWMWYYGYPDAFMGGPSWLGPGEPGYESVQFGVNIELLAQGVDGEYGTLRFYNHSVDIVTDYDLTFNGVQMIADYQTDVTNNSPRTVFDQYVEFSFYWDECQIFDAFAISSEGGIPEDISFDDRFAEWFSSEEGVAPGETISIFVSCYLPLDGWRPGTLYWMLDGKVDAWDGQVWRGFWEFYDDGSVYSSPILTHFPLIGVEATP